MRDSVTPFHPLKKNLILKTQLNNLRKTSTSRVNDSTMRTKNLPAWQEKRLSSTTGALATFHSTGRLGRLGRVLR